MWIFVLQHMAPWAVIPWATDSVNIKASHFLLTLFLFLSLHFCMLPPGHSLVLLKTGLRRCCPQIWQHCLSILPTAVHLFQEPGSCSSSDLAATGQLGASWKPGWKQVFGRAVFSAQVICFVCGCLMASKGWLRLDNIRRQAWRRSSGCIDPYPEPL